MNYPQISKSRTLQLGLLAALLMFASTPLLAESVPSFSFKVQEFVVEGDNPLDAETTQAVLADYLGEQEGLDGIDAASEALEAALAEAGYGFHRVVVPPQRARGGRFKLAVLAFRIGKVELLGNERFDDENIRRSLPAIQEGEIPNSREIARMLSAANEHPSKRVAVFMKEADEDGYLNARIQVRELKPWQVYTTLANTGSEDTGRLRWSVGYQHSNLFNLDHVLTLSYTTSPGHYAEVQQKGIYYRVPLYGIGASLSAFYTKSSVDQGTVADFFEVSGGGRFMGLSFEYTLLPAGGFSQKLKLSLEDRLFENSTTLIGTPFGEDVRSRPLSLRYTGKWEEKWGEAGVYAEYAHNLPGGKANDEAAYRSNRAFADPDWDLWRAGANLRYRFNADWQLRSRFSAQYSDEALISGEQFGLGGARSIRGFEERESSGESGVSLNLELWGPRFDNEVQWMGFLDTGRRHLKHARGDEKADETLTSGGLGLRWQWSRYFSLSADLARVLDGTDSHRAGDSRLHVNMLARY